MGLNKFLLPLLLPFILLWSCRNSEKKNDKKETGSTLAKVFDQYWEERMQLFPLEATSKGDYRYNDKLTITIAESFRDSAGRFYQKYLEEAGKIDNTSLNENDQLSRSVFLYEMQVNIDNLKFPTHYMPINQFWAFTLDLPVLGSGKGNQPFRNVKDYDDFLKRLSVFPAWADTAIYNMRKGISSGWVLSQKIVVKILPQLKAMLAKNACESIFYEPINTIPDSLPKSEKERLAKAYTMAIDSIVIPTYGKLYNFFEKEYLPKARNSSGMGNIPGGKDYYTFCVRSWTTTDMSPDSIYNIGLKEVARIETEMEKVKEKSGYKGDMHAFFDYLNKDKKFFPFATAKQVIDSFWNIKKQEDPQLKHLFADTPKSPFTIRQTEAFRAASASAEYNQPSEDGSRPGIFYVPILDAKKFNAVEMVTLFMHEAIPGHHYQISTQQENKSIPIFRRFLWYGAYGEGWALYSESLGKEIGMYDNPYQYFGHLGDAIHRAIRLVVDVGIHYKGMSREEAIKYMMAHEPVSEEGATTEIERYMAVPGQALSYKIGELTIRGERTKYELAFGSKFNIASFHTEVLKDGCVPLAVLKEKLVKWAESNK